MSNKSVFKWIRAIPSPTNGAAPDFYNFNLFNMRQIPTQLFTVPSNGIMSPIVTAYVPAGSWAVDKLILMRCYYQLTIPAGPLPPGYNVLEDIKLSQGFAAALPTGAALVPAVSVFTTYIERCVLRFGNLIRCFDMGDVMNKYFANLSDGAAHVLTPAAPVGGWDFTIPISIDFRVNLPVTIPGAFITAFWAECFMEQGTNLGKIP